MSSEPSATSAAPNTKTKRELFTARTFVIALAISIGTQLVTSGVFLWHGSQARNANCKNVEDAFAAYTDALAAVTDADASVVAEFRAAYEPELEECH